MMKRRNFLKRAVGTMAGLALLASPASSQEANAGSAGRRRCRFFVWNDVHVRDHTVPNRPGAYPLTNEKAAWAVECANGEHGVDPPDFVVSAGDIIDGEIADFGRDFGYLRTAVLDRLRVPFMPCLGNHENEQGEGLSEKYVAYDACFGPGWRNYAFTCGGVGFAVLDTSGGHRTPDDVTRERNRVFARAIARLEGLPFFLVTHVPLIAVREEAVLLKSFGWPSWRVLDPGVLELAGACGDRLIACLCGHIHLTGVRRERGILQIMASGLASYPSDFAAFDVFDDRLEVRMHQAPPDLLDRGGDIHGPPRFDTAYADADHATHEAYVAGNPSERSFTIPLEGLQRPRNTSASYLRVLRDTTA